MIISKWSSNTHQIFQEIPMNITNSPYKSYGFATIFSPNFSPIDVARVPLQQITAPEFNRLDGCGCHGPAGNRLWSLQTLGPWAGSTKRWWFKATLVYIGSIYIYISVYVYIYIYINVYVYMDMYKHIDLHCMCMDDHGCVGEQILRSWGIYR